METISFLTGKKDPAIEILLKLSNRDLLNACEVDTRIQEICNKPQLWYAKTLQEFNIDLTEIGDQSENYKEIYKRLYRFKLVIQGAKEKYNEILKEIYFQEDGDVIVLEDDFYDLAEYILNGSHLYTEQRLCEALISHKFGPGMVKLKPNYPTNFILLGKTGEPKIPTYCEQLASIEALQIINNQSDIVVNSTLIISLVVENKRLDLIYFFLKFGGEEEQKHILENIADYWTLCDFKFAIEGLKKVGMNASNNEYGLDLVMIFNKYAAIYPNILANFFTKGNIEAIDYLVEQGYIITRKNKDYMRYLQRLRPTAYGNMFDKYLYAQLNI